MPDFPPDAFNDVFATREQPIILGGQAVNLWGKIYSPRNHLKHVSMLILICAHYVHHIAEATRSGAARERDLINLLHRTHETIHSESAVEVARKYNLDFSEALPLDLDTTGLPKLANFYTNLQRQTDSENRRVIPI